MNKQVVKTLYTISWIMMECELIQLLHASLIPHRGTGKILWFPEPTQKEKPSRSGEPRAMTCSLFRVCVRETRPFSPQESNLLPWQEFLVLLHVHTSAFHSLLCHWVFLRFQRSKPGQDLLGEILIFWGKILGFFLVLFFGIFFWGEEGFIPFQNARKASK